MYNHLSYTKVFVLRFDYYNILVIKSLENLLSAPHSSYTFFINRTTFGWPCS